MQSKCNAQLITFLSGQSDIRTHVTELTIQHEKSVISTK